ncbi:hypothetical protein FISHEDRAFT_68933 [Fistulina hepatica ATCC 64428]|uniref:Helicase C-terminal domain-containing protein n=1 Tax=Fistulina hepatica ATCC 64428 TaxID=1128425 RepID=A0A0D7ANM3_9AGAR|nr:hypothetical protein FISHEDRAFT_68933 [Fistulina hepatica ATCC 64428]
MAENAPSPVRVHRPWELDALQACSASLKEGRRVFSLWVSVDPENVTFLSAFLKIAPSISPIVIATGGLRRAFDVSGELKLKYPQRTILVDFPSPSPKALPEKPADITITSLKRFMDGKNTSFTGTLIIDQLELTEPTSLEALARSLDDGSSAENRPSLVVGLLRTTDPTRLQSIPPVFQQIVFKKSPLDMIKECTVTPVFTTIPVKLGLSRAFDELTGLPSVKRLENIMCDYSVLKEVIKIWKQKGNQCQGQPVRTIVHCISFRHATSVQGMFRSQGVQARILSETSRGALISQFVEGSFPVLIVTEVQEITKVIPAVGLLIIARPVYSVDALMILMRWGLTSADVLDPPGPCHVVQIVDKLKASKRLRTSGNISYAHASRRPVVDKALMTVDEEMVMSFRAAKLHDLFQVDPKMTIEDCSIDKLQEASETYMELRKSKGPTQDEIGTAWPSSEQLDSNEFRVLLSRSYEHWTHVSQFFYVCDLRRFGHLRVELAQFNSEGLPLYKVTYDPRTFLSETVLDRAKPYRGRLTVISQAPERILQVQSLCKQWFASNLSNFRRTLRQTGSTKHERADSVQKELIVTSLASTWQPNDHLFRGSPVDLDTLVSWITRNDASSIIARIRYKKEPFVDRSIISKISSRMNKKIGMPMWEFLTERRLGMRHRRLVRKFKKRMRKKIRDLQKAYKVFYITRKKFEQLAASRKIPVEPLAETAFKLRGEFDKIYLIGAGKDPNVPAGFGDVGSSKYLLSDDAPFDGDDEDEDEDEEDEEDEDEDEEDEEDEDEDEEDEEDEEDDEDGEEDEEDDEDDEEDEDVEEDEDEEKN